MKPMKHLPFLAALSWGLLSGASLMAQQPVRAAATLPAEVADAVIAFYNRPETVRISGEATISAGTVLDGNLAVLEGPLVVEGRVRGHVVVLNGDAVLRAGARIDGDLTVAGGEISGLEEATVSGVVAAYIEPVRFRSERGLLVKSSPASDPELSAGRDFFFGRTDLLLAARGGYNRVEGLPITVGPRFETHGTHPIRLEAMAIYRTADGLGVELDDFGYLLHLEQLLGPGIGARAGMTLHSEVVPIEDGWLSDRENSLATFLLRRDYRDYYERVGWSAYLRFAPTPRPINVSLEYRDERHASLPTTTAWTPFGDRPWRAQPRVAEGRLRTMAGRARYDTRNDPVDPTTGWLIHAELETGLGGSAEWPTPFDRDADPCVDCDEAGTRFLIGHLDVRHYARLGPSSRLTVRALASSSLDDRPLPPQRQRTLGGEGSLPGYSAFRFDCGARSGPADADGLVPFYGCDRVALVQLEYQRDFPIVRGWGRKFGWDVDLGDVPGWVVFFDAGRAWTDRSSQLGRGGGPDDFAADAGMGIKLGRLGLFWALPLTGARRDVNFFVRLGPRL